MLEGWSFTLFVLAVFIFLGGFAVGTQWNLRKGDGALKWFRDGMPLIGDKTTFRWLGSSVVELKVQKAKDPFRNAETLVVFEPRDVFVLWAYSHARGRRDLLIFRAQLNTAPKFELEVFKPDSWTTSNIERNVKQKNWARLDSIQAPLLAYSSGAANNFAQPLISLAERAGGKLIRLSVHRTVPNLEVHWLLPDAKSGSSQVWFSNLRQIADKVLQA